MTDSDLVKAFGRVGVERSDAVSLGYTVGVRLFVSDRLIVGVPVAVEETVSLLDDVRVIEMEFGKEVVWEGLDDNDFERVPVPEEVPLCVSDGEGVAVFVLVADKVPLCLTVKEIECDRDMEDVGEDDVLRWLLEVTEAVEALVAVCDELEVPEVRLVRVAVAGFVME